MAAPFNITGCLAKCRSRCAEAALGAGTAALRSRALRVYQTPVMSCAPQPLRARPALTRCSARRALDSHRSVRSRLRRHRKRSGQALRAASRSTRPTRPGPVCCAGLQPPSASSRPVLAAKPSPNSQDQRPTTEDRTACTALRAVLDLRAEPRPSLGARVRQRPQSVKAAARR